MEKEIWKDIDEFPNYQVSNLGRVKNKKTKLCIHRQKRKNGYIKVELWKNGKSYTRDVHRLVAITFLGNKPEMVVNHDNGKKDDNRLENLYWCTRKENAQHAIKNCLFIPKAPEPKRKPIRIIETGEIFNSVTECAKAIDSSVINITNAVRKDITNHHSVKGLHFEYVNEEESKKKNSFLRDYQMDAVKKMKNGCILNGGVGSGKSRTGLYYYFSKHGGSIDPKYEPMKNPKDLYIITTAMKRDSLEWEKELLPFLISTKPEDNDLYSNKVIIDSWNNIKKYSDVKGAFFVFDEDKVTGYGAWVKAFLKIAKSNEWIILSASPADKWEDYIAVFIANGFYRNKTEFAAEHLVYSRYIKWRVDRYVGVKKLERLRNEILIDMDFHRDTVPHHEDVYCSYNISKYKDAMRLRWDPYKNEPIQQPAALCYVLRRIVNEDESRQAALLSIMEDHPRMIIFYNFNYERDILKKIFSVYEDSGIFEIAEWSGHIHEPIPESNSWAYLVQYTAGAEGWNCLKTNCIVFYSQNYSYKIMRQACGRIDRLNTPFKDLYYYHLKTRSGIDLAISKAIREKKKFNERKFVKWD